MTPTFNDKLLAYLVLLSGLAISGVAEYYSIMGLIAIYPAAVMPIIIMGIVLGLGKISATIWLKQNWQFAPWFLKTYILPAIILLMLITSLGVFGFLSKAHSDQSLVSGDVQSKIAIYDEKIKTAKENIEANRKQLKQMDEAVDQIMGRSQDEKGADKSNAVRKSQQRDRSALAKDIEANQRLIATLNDEAAPIRAEVRKVEAEVGPIKYIAHLLYGENPDANILEKAVIWVTVLIVIVLDPLAVILLLASQYSFQRFREQEDVSLLHKTVPHTETPVYVADVGEPPTAEELVEPPPAIVNTSTVEYKILEDVEEDIPILEKHPYLTKGDFWQKPEGWEDIPPQVYRPEADTTATETIVIVESTGTYKIFPELQKEIKKEESSAWDSTMKDLLGSDYKEFVNSDPDMTLFEKVEKYGYTSENGVVKVKNEIFTQEEFDKLLVESTPKELLEGYVQNEEQQESGAWNKVISEQEYRVKIEDKLNESKDNPNNTP